MLKALCDLYGLRKDEFDRVANEANYLATMNAARSDKERMLDFVRPGTIVEIGPGGGVVLDLLEARFPDAEVIGVDLSREVVTALEGRARAGAHRWKVVLGAAEDLPALVPAADTVVFCSILHEVYSYTEPRFQLASRPRRGPRRVRRAPSGRPDRDPRWRDAATRDAPDPDARARSARHARAVLSRSSRAAGSPIASSPPIGSR